MIVMDYQYILSTAIPAFTIPVASSMVPCLVVLEAVSKPWGPKHLCAQILSRLSYEQQRLKTKKPFPSSTQTTLFRSASFRNLVGNLQLLHRAPNTQCASPREGTTTNVKNRSREQFGFRIPKEQDFELAVAFQN